MSWLCRTLCDGMKPVAGWCSHRSNSGHMRYICMLTTITGATSVHVAAMLCGNYISLPDVGLKITSAESKVYDQAPN